MRGRKEGGEKGGTDKIFKMETESAVTGQDWEWKKDSLNLEISGTGRRFLLSSSWPVLKRC